MKNLLRFVLLIIIFQSCGIIKQTSLPEDELFLTRKYVGNFIECRHTGPERFGDPHFIWIKTTQDSVYGKISAYSRSCEFITGDPLFLRRTYYSPGNLSGYWIYQIESSNEKVYYRVSKFQYGNKVLVQTWF